jgi:predicted ATPase
MLMASAATGQLAHELSNEGGISSAMWAGERSNYEIKKGFNTQNQCH